MDLKHPLVESAVYSEMAMEGLAGGSKTIVKSPANPPWQYVMRSLHVAREYVKPFGFKFNGLSCYVVNRFALGSIMATRNAQKKLLHFDLLPGDWPGSPYLALADHYMQMRSAMSEKRHVANRIMFQYLRTWGYDGMKYSIIAGEALEDAVGLQRFGPAYWLDNHEREDKRFPLSAPGAVPREWAYCGMDAGSEDLKNNPDTPDNPPWFAAELKKACNIEA